MTAHISMFHQRDDFPSLPLPPSPTSRGRCQRNEHPPRYSILAVAASFACSHRCVDEDKMPATAEVLYISNSGPRRNLIYWARWSPWLPQHPLPFATMDSWKDAGRLWSGKRGRPNGRGRRVCRKSGELRHVVIIERP